MLCLFKLASETSIPGSVLAISRHKALIVSSLIDQSLTHCALRQTEV